MSKPFTVIGYWRGDRPVSVGVVEGEHDVLAGEGVTEEGDWAAYAQADSPEEAQILAIAEMRANNEEEGIPDDFDSDEEEGAEL